MFLWNDLLRGGMENFTISDLFIDFRLINDCLSKTLYFDYEHNTLIYFKRSFYALEWFLR